MTISKESSSQNEQLRLSFMAGFMQVLVFQTRQMMAKTSSLKVAEYIKKVAKLKPNVRIVFASAPSQTEFLEELTRIDGIPWSKVIAFHMDDYIGLPAEAPQRFSNWLEKHLFSKVPLGQVHYIPANGSADYICSDYSEQLSKGPIDIVCLGIGVNGHLAFNDPPVADFNDPSSMRIVELDDICRQQQVDDKCFGTISQVPKHAVTITIPKLISSEALFCVVPGIAKRKAVKLALEGPISTQCPASILRTHPNSTLFLDAESYFDG